MNKKKLAMILTIMVMLNFIVMPVVNANGGSCWWWNTEDHPYPDVSEGSQKVIETLNEYDIEIPLLIRVCRQEGGKNYTADGWWIFVFCNLTIIHNIPEPEPEPEPPKPDPPRPGRVIMEPGLFMWELWKVPHFKVKPDLDEVDHGGETYTLYFVFYPGPGGLPWAFSVDLKPRHDWLAIYCRATTLNYAGIGSSVTCFSSTGQEIPVSMVGRFHSGYGP